MTPGALWPLLAVVPPLLLASLVFPRRTRRIAVALAPWAGLPAAAASFLGGTTPPLDLSLVIEATRLGIDAVGGQFLRLTALLWAAAGLYAGSYHSHDERRHRFFFFFLLAMAGNFGLLLAGDMISFYTSFAMMSFAAYGLVAHDGHREALRAARIYLVLVMIGEVALISAFVIMATEAETIQLPAVARAVSISADRHLIASLLLAGFGIKAGCAFLHMWLPLAHPAAPTPASAVLSGAMIKAGLIGWLRFLPLGDPGLEQLGQVMVTLGVVSIFWGVVCGLPQKNPKTVLAYSSISQMGYLVIAIGFALAVPASWQQLLPAVTAYALHHGMAKGALFLGIGVARGAVARRWAMWVGLSLPALALSGAPGTSGAAAKSLLKSGLSEPATLFGDGLPTLLAVGALGTTLLMGRLFLLLKADERNPHSHPVGLGMWVGWSIPLMALLASAAGAFPAAVSLGSLWPLLLGAVLVWGALRFPSRLQSLQIPEGDLVVIFERGFVKAASLCRALGGGAGAISFSWLSRLHPGFTLVAADRALTRWSAAGVLWLVVTATMFVLLFLAG